MKWNKKGLIYVPDGSCNWAKTHAMLPTPELMGDQIRIYFGSCDAEGVGRLGAINVSAEDPAQIISIEKDPLLDIGLPGAFDDNGVVPSSIVTLEDGRKLLYYVGFEKAVKIRYRLLTGVAVSNDQGLSFKKIQNTPILERSNEELYFRCGPFINKEKDLFKLWYVAGSEWITLNGKSVPVYTIRYLESPNGLTWGSKGKECITISNNEEHGFGRPYVIKDQNLYRMFYSIRLKNEGYRLGYAESIDGKDWQRKDEQMGLEISKEGWDCQTLCYTAYIKYKNKSYLFYNGNDFGKTGLGYACLEE